MADEQRIAIAKIVNTHGLRGELRVHSYNPDSELLVRGVELDIGSAGAPEVRRVAAARRHGRVFLLTFAGCDSIAEAEKLVGREIWVQRDQLPATGPSEIYHFELIGMRVITTAGEDLGVIDEVISAGSNDVCVVHGPRGEHLIPFIDDVVKEIDKAGGRLTIEPIPGLLEP